MPTSSGCVETPAGTPLPVRLRMLYSGLQLLMERHYVSDVAMEALTAASVAALTVYDMAKAVDKEMRIADVVLVEKTKERVA